jgi:hypothetical protein
MRKQAAGKILLDEEGNEAETHHVRGWTFVAGVWPEMQPQPRIAGLRPCCS